ncbi:YHYH domain-containing protein [Sinorhizobium meliloti]|nr:YHYH domain-containing protein [Sinorhizobium meliloti]MQV01794.1 YHYH domain-containing protein [Sinorhizobium meliloti]
MRIISILQIIVIALLTANSAFAHGGGTDDNGCHTNHKTGQYHCH